MIFASNPSEPDRIGWGLTAALFLVLLGLAVSKGFYYHMTYRLVTRVRGGLVSIIYAKTVDVSVTALNESVAMTLMSSDMEGICLGIQSMHDLWAVPLELSIATYILFLQVGVASAAPITLAVLALAGILGIAKYMGAAQKIWMQGIQVRVHHTAAMLGSMKSVKMLGLSTYLGDLLQGLRVEELRLARLFRKLLVVRVFLANGIYTLGPVVTLAVFVLQAKSSGSVLNAESAYTALSLVSLIAWPVNGMIAAVPAFNAALASLMRIQTFLESDARKDHRVPFETGQGTSNHNLPLDEGIELQDKSTPRNTGTASPVMSARNVSLSWTSDDAAVVRDASFDIRRGQISLIIGPVGCGKSSLLKGILGEMPSTKGFLHADCAEVAYVDQTPWIRNSSFRDNILGVSVYEEARYREAVEVCGLEQDVALLPNGHRKFPGSESMH